MSKFRFPFYVFATAFLVYVITLSRGITLDSMPLTAQLAGWDWQPTVNRPVFWLVTLPFRILPAGWVAVALNLFSAFFAALTLGLLARSIDLLPWRRAAGGGRGWPAKIPIVLACVVCGLEFSFWREATAQTGETLDVLLFAATLWCLFEFHKSRASQWLDGAALLFGLAIADNFILLLALPVFVIALIWLKRFDFLDARFLTRSALLLLAGIATYALLPTVNGLNPWSPWSFIHAWSMSLTNSRHVAGTLRAYFWHAYRLEGIELAVYFVIASLPFLVRFQNSKTKFKSTAQMFQIQAHRGLLAVLLVVFMWLAFDPLPGPRQLVRQKTGLSLSLLTFDYLMALSMGYIVGDFLVTALRNARRAGRRSRRRSREPGSANSIPALAFATLTGLMALGLVLRNTSAIYAANRNPLESFGDLAVQSLPPGGGIVLCDETEKLYVFDAALSHRRERRDWVTVNTRALPQADYRKTLERQHPGGWLTTNSAHELKAVEMLALLEKQLASHRIFYLNPSFGYFFERFYLEPSGFIYEMKGRPGDGGNPPALESGNVDAGEKFWTAAWQDRLQPLVRARETNEGVWWKYLGEIGLTPAVSQQTWLPAMWASATLNAWGVELQRLDRLKPARERFEQARAVRTNNFVAMFNLECNTNLQAGRTMGLEQAPLAARWLGDDDRQIALILERCGPFDQPDFCYLMGCIFQKTGLLHQASEELERAAVLAPNSIASQVILAQVYSGLHQNAKVFELVQRLHPLARSLPATNTLDVQLSLLEAGTWMSQTNPARAREILQEVVTAHPKDPGALDLVARAYLSFGDFTNALQLVKKQIATDPDNETSLIRMASILMLMGKPAEALPLLDHAIALAPSPLAYISRATANLQTTNLAGAEADYLQAETKNADPYLVHYGLAEVDLRRKETNAAIREFAFCLTNTPEGTARWKDIYARLKAIKLALDGAK